MRNHARGPILLMRVDAFVASRLNGIYRKGKEPKLVIEHAREVAELLRIAQADTEVQASGLLHDVPEHTGIPFELIDHLFGETVCRIVMEVTDPPEFKNLPTDIKKQRQAQAMKTALPESQMVRVADMISNLRELLVNPPVEWDQKKVDDYTYGDLRIAHICRDASSVLNGLFMEAYTAVRTQYNRPATRT